MTSLNEWFPKGLTVEEYIASMKVNKEKMLVIIEELELRREQEKAKKQLGESKKKRLVDQLNNLEIKKGVPFYDWLNA